MASPIDPLRLNLENNTHFSAAASGINSAATSMVYALLGATGPKGRFVNSKSIYSRLKPYVDKEDERLDPEPELNAALSELVIFLQGKSHSTLATGTPFATIAQQACRQIDADAELCARAQEIREVAGKAESRLELHFVRKVLDKPLPASLPLQCLSPAERVIYAARDFPYIENYAMMVGQEARLLATMRASSHIVFCGSGPLPISGALFAAHMDARVTLIDCDEGAVRLSRELMEAWECCGVLPAGRVRVCHENGSNLRFCKMPHSDEDTCNNGLLACDVIFIAALVPNHVKETLVRAAGALGNAAPLVVLRSAHGLTARLAYPPTHRPAFSKYLPLLATVVPAAHAVNYDAPPAVDADDQLPVDWFPADILNSLEIYGWSHA